MPLPLWLLEWTACGAIAVLAVLMLRPLVRRTLGSRAAHLLWLIVAVRLAVPVMPETPFSVLPSGVEKVSTERVAVHVVTESDEKTTRQSQGENGLPVKSGNLESFVKPMWIPWFMYLWIGGAGITFALSLAAAFRAGRLIRRSTEITNRPEITTLLASLPVSVRGLRVCETSELRSPALCGLVRPTILLPPGWAQVLSPEEVRWVLLHEIGHHRRGDLAWRWVFAILRAVHWFNPLVWVADRSMQSDQELACDEWVLIHGTTSEVRQYGEVLLRVCGRLPKAGFTSAGHAAMAESAHGIERRIRELVRVRRRGWFTFAVTAGIVGVGILALSAPSSDAGSDLAEKPPAPSQNTPALEPQNPAPPQSVTPAGVQVEITTRMVEISGNVPGILKKLLPSEMNTTGVPRIESIMDEAEFRELMDALAKEKGIDLLTAPKVSTRSGQPAVIEIIREFRFPTKMKPANDGTGHVVPTEFETRNVGVTMEVQPTVTGQGKIDLKLNPKVVEFLGFVDYGHGRPPRDSLSPDAMAELLDFRGGTEKVINQPVFSTRQITTLVSINSGETVLLGGMGRTDQQTVRSDSSTGTPDRVETFERYLFVFVTATILHAEK